MTLGSDLEAALQVAVEVETLARMYLQALQLGAPPLLSAAQMQQVHAQFKGLPLRTTGSESEVMTEERFRRLQNLHLDLAVTEAMAFVGEGLDVHWDALCPGAAAIRSVCSGTTALSCRP